MPDAFDVVVIGAGPAGYPAAIRAAQFIDVVSGESKSASATAFDAAHILADMPVTLLLNYGD